MGKTSLMNRLVLRLRKEGISCVAFDVGAELGRPEDPRDWYGGLVARVAEDLELPLDGETWWKDQATGTINQRLLRFFREEVAGRTERSTVIFLDEIDSTLELAYTDDLFRVIRAMYNDRALVPAYKQIAFCLIGVATPNELIKDRRSTAYNIGRTLELRDFDPRRDDLSPLYRAFDNAELGEEIVSEVLKWTGGHPFLTQRVCNELLEAHQRGGEQLREGAVAAHVEQGFSSLTRLGNDTHFEQILRFLGERVGDVLATLILYERILGGAREPDRPTAQHIQLKLSGLVKRDEEGLLCVRNRIYERLFNREWVSNTKPQLTVRRWRQAAAFAAVVVLLLVLATVYNTYVREPTRLVATEQLATLNATLDEAQALEVYEVLTGERWAPGVEIRGIGRVHLSGYEERGGVAYKGFWERRASQIEAAALRRLEVDKVDEALILGALAAKKRHGAVHPDLLKAFQDRHYERLLGTYRGDLNCCQAALSRDGKKLAFGLESGVAVWDVQSGQRLHSLPHPGQVSTVDFSPDGSRLYSGTNPAERTSFSIIWDLAPEQKVAEFSGNGRGVARASFSADGRQIIVAFYEGSLGIWDPETGRELARLAKDGLGVDFSADGQKVIAALRDNTVRIWDSQTAKELLRTAVELSSSIWTASITFSPDGEQFVVVDDINESTSTVVRDAHDGKALFSLVHEPGAKVVAYSYDGQLIAITTGKGFLTIWEVASGEKACEFQARSGELYSLMFSPAADWIITVATGAGSGRRWDIRDVTGQAELAGPPKDPDELWQKWQKILALTVDENDEVIPLWPTGPQEVQGWDPSLEASF